MIKKLLLSCLILLLSILSTSAAGLPLSFERFQYNDKLPSNSVIRTFNDNDGYMWFGTKDGLCRFDGYDVKVFRSSAFTPGILTNNEIQCIAEDKNQRIWVGTFEGINIIDKRNFTIKALDNEFVKKERINSIICDKDGYIWVGTSTVGIIRINPETLEFERYSTDSNSKYKIQGNNITNLYQDRNNRIWISSWRKGLSYIDLNKKKVVHTGSVGANDNPFRVFQDKDGLFWICTWGDGIFTMKVDTNGKTYISPIYVNGGITLDNIVYSITQDDKYGLIWLVTFRGMNLIEKLADGTCRLVDTESLFQAGTSRLFHEINKDQHGNIWLGSVGDGLYKLDFNKQPIRNYPLSDITYKLNLQSNVTKIVETSPGNVYVAINRIGIFYLDMKTGAVNRPADPKLRSLSSISSILYEPLRAEIWISDEGEAAIHVFKESAKGELAFIRTMTLNNTSHADDFSITSTHEDTQHNVWIGTDQGLFVKQMDKPMRLVSSRLNMINAIEEDHNHNIWVGTEKEGAFVLKGKQMTPEAVPLMIKNYKSLSVQSICATRRGQIYIGTKEGCIYLYNEKEHTAVDISGQYAITDEGILDIVEDNNGILWISTIKKIIRFSPQNQTAIYYSTADGMLVSSFFKGARTKTSNGTILFGGNKGVCAFTPGTQAKIAEKSHKVSITDILVENKSIFEDDEEMFHFDSEDNKVTLKYSENNLNIEFSALDYTAAGKIQYAYRLLGVDKKWNYVSNNRRDVNYANLPSGNYTFQVKASDENGNWGNQVTSLEVQILPPLYLSWWAYLIYLILAFVAAYFTSRILINRLKLRNELKISLIEKEKSEELTQIKLRYFTNISHELLTPLTIIMLQIESMRKKNIGDASQFDIMKENVIRLKRLIQQILIFRKTESGNMKLRIRENDIVAFVNNICKSNFKPLVNQKKIKFNVNVEPESYLAYFDPDKLDKIIYNLLSNAFKHTPNGGEIMVKVVFLQRGDIHYMRLSVSDTGEGIAEQDIPHIFKRFYISSSSDQSQSHGIGLALTNDLIEMHKGTISVKSQLGEGAVFTIEIPVSKEIYSEEDLAEDEIVPADIPDMQDAIVAESEQETEPVTEEHEDSTILIVEDNKELQDLIVNNFAGKYNVLTADNGVKALEVLNDHEIDLIITDVMMPEMDGLTFCKMVKNDIATSHINVLVLTAKNSTEDRIEAYNAGADSYIAKPFELSVLNARTRNLVRKRQQKTETFQKNQDINISAMEYGSIDELFLKQAVKIVENKLADETFDFDQFAVDMATSKSTLHRKLKSLTGLSPGEFIRNIRLKHAALMLTKNSGNISEIAFAVGFNDPKYFSRCFKIEFGLTPREYQESQKS